jgi:hypothetical protein
MERVSSSKRTPQENREWHAMDEHGHNLKSCERKLVRVRSPPSAPLNPYC